MDATKIVGQNIRKYRLEKGLKLETLAKSIRIDKATMSKIETGQAEITISRIEKISISLQIDYNLLAGINQPKSLDIVQKFDDRNDRSLLIRILDLSERIIELSKKQNSV